MNERLGMERAKQAEGRGWKEFIQGNCRRVKIFDKAMTRRLEEGACRV